MHNGLNGSLNGHADAPLPPSADGTAAGGKDAATGRFLPGNKCGRGNPHYRVVSYLRCIAGKLSHSAKDQT
jgi:hypothetical protein